MTTVQVAVGDPAEAEHPAFESPVEFVEMITTAVFRGRPSATSVASGSRPSSSPQ